MNIAKLKRENEQYRRANPWHLHNLQNSQALCGRFPTREAAIAEADRRGGAVAVDEIQKRVSFSEMPCL